MLCHHPANHIELLSWYIIICPYAWCRVDVLWWFTRVAETVCKHVQIINPFSQCYTIECHMCLQMHFFALMENIIFLTIYKMITLQGTNISHLGKRKIIFKMPFLGDMLVPWRVIILSLTSYNSATINLISSMKGPCGRSCAPCSWWEEWRFVATDECRGTVTRSGAAGHQVDTTWFSVQFLC